MSDKGTDKTEKPTPQRLRNARKEGDVSRSQDLSKTMLLLLWILLFWASSGLYVAAVGRSF
jgi:type III secretion protein U